MRARIEIEQHEPADDETVPEPLSGKDSTMFGSRSIAAAERVGSIYAWSIRRASSAR